MKKYIVGVSYVGSIGLTVKAENEDTACKEAEEIVKDMGDEEFLHHLDPQFEESYIVKELE